MPSRSLLKIRGAIWDESMTTRFEDALVMTTRLHAQQKRKGTDIPYISHLMAVCAIVLEHGGDEDEAIAALLHDSVEDQGGAPVLAEIRQKFGNRVAGIVDACTDTDITPKPPWRQRKQAYIEAIAHKSDAARRVSLADKLHNIRSISRDYRHCGEELWKRFNAGKADQLWYYRALADSFLAVDDGALVQEFNRCVEALVNRATSPQTSI